MDTAFLVMLSEAKHLWLFILAVVQKNDPRFFALLRMTRFVNIKNPDRNFDPGLKCYPADAV